MKTDRDKFIRKYGVRPEDVAAYELRNGAERVVHRYELQRRNARERKIEWLFDLKTWMEVWEGKIAKRARGYRGLCMCRHKDEGPYAPWNVRIATGYENMLDWWERKPRWCKQYGDLPNIDRVKADVGIEGSARRLAHVEEKTRFGQ